MKSFIKYCAKPELNNPYMLAAWPGVGNVAITLALYLKNKLKFKELGEIDAAYFFDPVGVTAKNNVIEAPRFPQSKFYYWKNTASGKDIVLFIGEDQPSSKIYDMANCVLDAGLKVGVQRVITFAAALTNVHYTEQPRVWAVATSPSVAEELPQYDLLQRGNMQIAGLNGLLLGAAKEKGINGICLLGEVPSYSSQVQNPMAALAILKILTKMLSIEIDATELEDIASETQENMKEAAATAMGEYIEHFTQPIWEQSNGEEDDEEDDYDEYEE